MKWLPTIVLASIFLAPTAEAAGFVHNENFTVFTPAQPSQQAADEYATALLEKAEHYRKQIAIEWLGEELPPSIGQTIVNVSFSARRDQGHTWAKDQPNRKYHTLYLVGSPTQDLDSLLAHEMVHVVLATRYPHPERLPAWLEEGIACRYDNRERRATRERIVKWLERTANWPQLLTVLDEPNISSHDQSAYAVCATLTDMLLARSGKETLIKFGQTGQQLGWDRALRQHYGIHDVGQLQADWQLWVTRATSPSRMPNVTDDQR